MMSDDVNTAATISALRERVAKLEEVRDEAEAVVKWISTSTIDHPALCLVISNLRTLLEASR